MVTVQGSRETDRVIFTARSDWSQLLFPSVCDLIFLISFWALVMGPLSSRPLADADIGWHIRAGEQILANGAVPRVDSFSSTMHGHPWFAWEWLYDLLLGVVYRAMGLNGVVLLAALLMSASFALLFRELIRRQTGLPLATFLWMVALGGASIHMFARPHIASWLLTLGWFIALERLDKGRTPRWLSWLFPVSMLLWVNLHAGWVMGLTFLGLYTIASYLESFREKNDIARIQQRKRARLMFWMLCLAAAATLVNPYGIQLHSHIYRYLSDPYLMNRISEFRSPDFHGMGPRCYVLILAMVLIAFAVDHRKIRLSEWLIVPMVAYSGVYAARNLPLASMILVLIAGPKLWRGLVDLADRGAAWSVLRKGTQWVVKLGDRANEQERQFRGHLWPAAAVIGALALCLHDGNIGSTSVVQAAFDPRHLPVGAVNYLRQESSSEPVFCPDQWGGYLIYQLYPRRRVVIDDRHDLYGADRFREYDILMNGAPRWREMLDKWQLRTIVVQPDSTLVGLLRQLPNDWQFVYEDPVAVVIEKK